MAWLKGRVANCSIATHKQQTDVMGMEEGLTAMCCRRRSPDSDATSMGTQSAEPRFSRTLRFRLVGAICNLVSTPAAMPGRMVEIASSYDAAHVAGLVHDHQVTQPQQREHAMRPLCRSLLPAKPTNVRIQKYYGMNYSGR